MITNEEMRKGESEDEEKVKVKFDSLTLRECDNEVTSEERVKEEKEKEESYTANSQRVFMDGDLIYDVNLIHSNLQNINSKFYKMSLLEDDNKRYDVMFRWGRCGTDGMFQIFECGSNLEKAKILFSRKFVAKTGNDFPTAIADFKAINGMYTMIDRQMEDVNIVRIVGGTKKEEQLPMWDTQLSGPAFVTGLPSLF